MSSLFREIPDEIKMAYKYNAKAYYAPYGKHRELIAAGDLGKLEIVVRDDNEKSEIFRLKW